MTNRIRSMFSCGEKEIQSFQFFYIICSVKILSILILKLLLIGIMLLKPILVCNYLIKDSNDIAVLELAESEEDKSEETSLESADEIFHWIHVEWSSNSVAAALKKSPGLEIDKEEHIREIVPPPPQA
jgi:hypothetical protein